MKNEIIRKITSLTLMTIMFAGGMTLAVPSFLPMEEILPAAYAENDSTTEGMLTVSSTQVQGAQVIKITVSDPAISNVLVPQTFPTVDIVGADGTSIITMTQVVDGSWEAYVADESTMQDADGISSTGLDFGTDCLLSLAVPEGFTIGAATGDSIAINTWVESVGGATESTCDNPNVSSGTQFSTVQAESSVRQAPMISLGTTAGGQVQYVGDLTGQIGHDTVSWPFIYGIELASDSLIAYGGDAIAITYGPENAGSELIVNNGNPFVVQGQSLTATIVDNGLNIDPTSIETWTFGSSAGATSGATARTSGATTNIAASLGIIGFGDNGILALSDGGSAICAAATSGCSAASTYVFVETGANTGVFDAHDGLGNSPIDIKGDADVDDVLTFSYGGNSVAVTVATNNASATLSAGANWAPGEAATYTVSDPDMNKNSSLVETLNIQDDNVIPTIIIGSPKYLVANDIGYGPTLAGLHFAASDVDSFDTYPSKIVDMGDGSKRVKITTSAGTTGASSVLTINTKWDASTFNPCTAATCADSTLDTAGSQVLSYDICSITDYLGSTVISVKADHAVEGSLVAQVEEGTNICAGEIDQTELGAVFDCDAACAVEFTITHDSIAGKVAEYVIAMDLNNFRQGEAADAIYRMEAVETGPNTGVFEGTVAYNVMNTVNSKAGTALNQWLTAADTINTAGGSDVVIMLDNYKTGSSGIEVTYGDTDVLGSANITVAPPRLDATTHNGVLSWDQTSYGVGDAATITVVDADLNTDSSLVETYIYTGADGTADTELTFVPATDMFTVLCDDLVCSTPTTIKLVEESADSDTFVAIFTVTDDIGEDMEIGYRDSRDANGVATIWYATATIGSTTGTISLDRQVYPVPFDTNELKTGANAVFADWDGSGSTQDGDVIIAIQITDPDETGTTIAKSSAPGTLKLITSGTTNTLGTFGGTVANAATSSYEFGPLTEVEQGSNVYEISITLDETMTTSDVGSLTSTTHQILGGQTVVQVTYTDPNGDNGLPTSVYDSSIFDLRNGSLTTDKSVYVMGQTMVITITDPDLDLDSATAETYSLSLIEWDSAADSSELLSTAAFTKNPTALEETGDSTGVFQTTVDIPTGVSDGANANALELGEVIIY